MAGTFLMLGRIALSYSHVLDGVKVLDFTQFIAGPACTRMMAEMGAEVVKIEMAPNGDLVVVLPEIREGRSAYFVAAQSGQEVGLRGYPQARKLWTC